MANTNHCVEIIYTKTLKDNEKTMPETPGQGLIVKVHYAGICHTDMHLWENKLMMKDEVAMTTQEKFNKAFPVIAGKIVLPVIAGHEISGEVYSIGAESCPEDPELSIGERVVVYPWISGCNKECEACLQGHDSLCTSKKAMFSFFGMHLDGGYQQYVSVPKRNMVFKVPKDIEMDVAAMVPCSGLTAYNAVVRAQSHIELITKYRGSASVVVHGVGGVGMWAVSIAKAILPKTTKVIAMDRDASKLKTAIKSAHADDTVQADLSALESNGAKLLDDVTCGGADAILDFVGLGSMDGTLVNCLNEGGMLVLVGLAGGTMPLSVFETVCTRRTVTGTLVIDACYLQDIFQLLSAKQICPPPIEHCKLTSAAIGDVFRRMEEKKLDGRVIIKMKD